MKYLKLIKITAFVFIISTLTINETFCQRLTVSSTGSKILKEGNPITLRGVNFGNWLLWEGYMMDLDKNGIKSHSQIRAGIKNLLSNSETKTRNFETAWRNNYITDSDFAQAKQLGFNVVRVPFHYNMFWNALSGTVKNDGFTWLDKALNFASANNIYVIFCMHAAPGYQNPEHHSDNPGNTVGFWNSNWNNVEIAKSVWEHVANRYKNYSGNKWLAGYDLLNEPLLDNNKDRLKQAYKEMTASIRSVDSNHLIFAEGNYYSSDFYDMQERWDSNLVFSNHYYGPQGQSNPNPDLNTIKNLATNLNIPLWTGEFGENTSTWVKAARIDYDSQNVGWAFWAWKRQETDRAIYSFNSTYGWNRITDYLKNGTRKPSLRQTERWLGEIVDKIKLSNSSFKSTLHNNLIPSKPINQYVWLRNNNKYVTSNNGIGPVTANRTSIGGWEKFRVVDAGDGKIALRGNNKKYVNSQNGNSAMTCNSNAIAGWESFEWIDVNGDIALKGFNGKFVSAEGGASSGMNCNRETVSGWEAFDWSTISASKMVIGDLDAHLSEEDNLFLLYPNPAGDYLNFNIDTKYSKNFSVEIYTVLGIKVLEFNNGSRTLDIGHLKAGNYILKINSQEGKQFSKLFVKN